MRSAISVPLEKKRLGDLLDADALGCHLLDGEKFLHGADHSRCENAHTHLGFEPNVAVLHGMRRESVLCVDVKCANICCFITYFYSGEGDFSSKSAKKTDTAFFNFGLTFSIRFPRKTTFFIRKNA